MKEVLVRKFFKAVVFSSLLLSATFSLFSSSSWSQSKPDATEAKSLAPFAPPPFSYSSVFHNYRGYQDQEVASWLEANETVGRIGGWRYYLEEAFQEHPHPIAQPEDAHRHSGHGGKP
jgi:hypothetical protein